MVIQRRENFINEKVIFSSIGDTTEQLSVKVIFVFGETDMILQFLM